MGGGASLGDVCYWCFERADHDLEPDTRHMHDQPRRFVKILAEIENKLSQFLRLGFPLGAAAIGFMALVSTVIFDKTAKTTVDSLVPSLSQRELDERMATIHAEITALKLGQPNDVDARPLTSSEAAILSRRMDQIEARQRRIEVTITNNPARSLELPIIRRDLDNNKENALKLFESMEQAVDRVYDLCKWLVGGLAISVIGLGLSNFFSARKSEPKS
jgi:hypothetical protein